MKAVMRHLENKFRVSLKPRKARIQDLAIALIQERMAS